LSRRISRRRRGRRRRRRRRRRRKSEGDSVANTSGVTCRRSDENN
jgi:hypothetical protein